MNKIDPRDFKALFNGKTIAEISAPIRYQYDDDDNGYVSSLVITFTDGVTIKAEWCWSEGGIEVTTDGQTCEVDVWPERDR